MRIVIIGAGEVGFHVAKSLSELDYDIAVVDTNHKKCQRANEHLDVIVIKGNGSDEKVLEQANVADADYVFTLTDSDETNLISSMQAHNLGAKKIIARLRDFDYSKNGHSVIPEKFGIDMVIHPEAAVAQEIIRLVKHPYADKFYEFENGKAVLFSKKINHRSNLVGSTVEDFHKKNTDFKCLVIAIMRDEKMTIPSSSFKFEPDDYVFFFTKSKNLDLLLNSLGISSSNSKRVMIAGASKIGRLIARQLEAEMSVRLIDNAKDKAVAVANELNDSIKDTGKDAKSTQDSLNTVTGGAVGRFNALKTNVLGAVKSFKSLRVAIIASGIGALVLAVVALGQAFTRSEAGQNKFAKLMGVIGSIINNLLDVLADLGEALIKVFEDPQQAIKDFANLIKDNIFLYEELRSKKFDFN